MLSRVTRRLLREQTELGVKNIARLEQADDEQKGPKHRTFRSTSTGVDVFYFFSSKYQLQIFFAVQCAAAPL